ncbi:FAD-dependent monooxygenase [Microbacterium testaceum]|uniref:FAD-dependent monooxygenase n=1 Tax=Microbacterium testaceum TaxID=2033 RepID=UPI0037F360E0
MKILIAGAGIGGLTMARMATIAGHDVVVAERAPRVRADGAGILLDRAALATLSSAGFDLQGLGRPLTTMAITTSAGAERGAVRGRSSFAREELVAELARGAGTVAEIQVGSPVRDVVDEGDHVRCTVAGRTVTVDLVIGADGLLSTVRAAVDPRARVRETGQVCWRGIVEMDAGSQGTELWNGVERIGVVPLLGGRTYVYVVRAHTAPGEGLGQRSALPARERTALSLLSGLPEDHVLRHEVRELERPSWGRGRVLLLGDAAHALTPNLGLGAALAVDDAAVIAAALDDPSMLSRRYRVRRHRVVRATQLLSRQLGSLAHDQGPVARLARAAAGLNRSSPGVTS